MSDPSYECAVCGVPLGETDAKHAWMQRVDHKNAAPTFVTVYLCTTCNAIAVEADEHADKHDVDKGEG